MTSRYANLLGAVGVVLLWFGPVAATLGNTGVPVVINEILASNVKTGSDPQGEYDDWIELYNAGDRAVDVGGMYLTDDLSMPTKWKIPTGLSPLTTIPAKWFLLIWADNEPADIGLHANFQINSDGEEIGLFDKDGNTLVDTVTLGAQDPNISYGRYPDASSDWRFFAQPSPRSPNVDPYLDSVADTKFSHDRGFYDAPFSVAITTDTAGATIHYTLDGTSPFDIARGLPAGLIYSGPIPIATTTCLRAMAVKDGWKPSKVDAVTYIFLKDVIRQPRNPSAFPLSWGSQAADYEMDPDITTSAAYGPLMEEALLSIPTLSIVMNTEGMFGTNGIYANPNSRGVSWERPTSVELIYPDGRQGFQINCGIRIQGGAFRGWGLTTKKSFRLLFKGIYGPNKLRFPLFADDAVDEFDTITLRAGANDGYAWGSARYTEQYTRDEFGRALQRATGSASSHGTFVHLYVNGLYWGLYNPVERPDHSFSAAYYGGDPDHWDAISNDAATNGDMTAWNQMVAKCQQAADSSTVYQELQGRNPDGTPNPAYPNLLDVNNYVDYIIVNLWGGNWDWPNKNYWVGRDRSANSTGFKAYCWDYENTMGNNLSRSPLTMDTMAFKNNLNSGVGKPHYYLRNNVEYRLLFADRVHRFLFNGGVLTPESLIGRYEALAAGVELAIIGESARWGDQHSHPPLTLEDWYDHDGNFNDGRAGRDWLLKYYLPQRTAIVLQQFKDAGLYPNVVAPVFQINGSYQHGGQTPSNAQLSMTAPAGKIYYTLDGSEPRWLGTSTPPAGTTLVSSSAPKRVLVPTGPVSDNWRGGATFGDSAWASVTGSPGGVGYDRNPSTGGDYRPYISQNVETQMYGNGKNATCYIRVPFTVIGADLGKFNFLTLKMLYDDGFVAYLNGTEVSRAAFTGTPAWNSTASTSRSAGTAPVSFDLSGNLWALRSGDNTLAIHGLNSSTNSDDFLIWAELSAGKTTVPVEAGVSPTAVEYKGPITLAKSVRVKARVKSGDTWSALNEAVYAVGPVAESLRITEIMYHPKDTGNPSDPNTEFIELTNIGVQTINLNLVQFTNGVDFTFGDMTLQPNKYILVVKDLNAFTAKYGQGLPIAGTYAGSLDNAGERIRLEDAVGKVIHDFQYSDGWYDITDGSGFSLTVKDPAGIGADPGSPGSKSLWRASANIGGSPGY